MATRDALYLRLKDGEILRWLGSPDKWERIGNDGRIISMAPDGNALYLLFNDGEVLRWLGSPDKWERIGNDGRIVSMAANGNALYLLLKDGEVLHWRGSPDNWQRIGNDGRIVSMAAGGNALYLLFNDGEVLRWLGSPDSWERIGNDGRIVSIAGNGNAPNLLFRDGEVLRWRGNPDNWQRIGNDGRIISMAADGNALYLLFNDGEVLRWLGSPDSWERIGNDSRIVSMAAAGNALYLLFNNGEVLRWLDSPDKWERIGNDGRIAFMAAASGLQAPDVAPFPFQPYRFVINSVDVLTQKADHDHSDSAWLTFCITAHDPTVKGDVPVHTTMVHLGGEMRTGDHLVGDFRSDFFTAKDTDVVSVSYVVVNLGSSDEEDQFAQAVKLTNKIVDDWAPIVGAAVGLIVGDPAAGIEFAGKITDGFDKVIKIAGDAFDFLGIHFGPANCNGEVLHDTIVFQPGELSQAVDKSQTRSYTGSQGNDRCGAPPEYRIDFSVQHFPHGVLQGPNNTSGLKES